MQPVPRPIRARHGARARAHSRPWSWIRSAGIDVGRRGIMIMIIILLTRTSKSNFF